MKRNEKYSDVLEKTSGPPEYIAGVALRPTDKLLIESNAKFIHWRAIDIMNESPSNGGYGWEDKIGIKVIMEARRRGVILRPLSNVIVLMPPLSISIKELEKLLAVTRDSIYNIQDHIS